MILKNIIEAEFVERKNRFVGIGKINNKKIEFHIADTGRLNELLYSGNKILLQKTDNPKRKYKLSLIATKGLLGNFILVNSLLHSALVKEFLVENNKKFTSEVKIGESRIDFLIENTFVEIKGCSLIKKINNEFIAMFPDAPTSRGQKHLQELTNLIKNGKKAEIWFLLTNNVNKFKPNTETDPAFSKLFYNFLKIGGNIKFLVANLKYQNDQIKINLTEKKLKVI